MTDLPFILAAYLVIVGGLAVYTLALLRRLARARREAPGSTSAEPDEGR
jgi:uncharacterized integral membrane protein